MIERYAGSTWTFNYFAFLERYHRDPSDIGELLDGLDCMTAKSKLEEYWIDKG